MPPGGGHAPSTEGLRQRRRRRSRHRAGRLPVLLVQARLHSRDVRQRQQRVPAGCALGVAHDAEVRRRQRAGLPRLPGRARLRAAEDHRRARQAPRVRVRRLGRAFVHADPVFFRDLALVLVAAVLGGSLAWLVRQPLVLGYVLGGIAISQFTPGPSIADTNQHFEVFAEIGVVLLMFAVGLEFSLKDLLRVKWVALVGGPVGTLLNIALAVVVGVLLGWPPRQGLVVGVVISVASTMVLARLLLDRGELHTRHGRVLVGTSLV